MKRIQLVLAALAIVVTSLAAFSGPAMAQNLDCRDARGELVRCDGELYAPYNNDDYYYNNDDYYYNNDYGYPPLYSPFYSNDGYYADDLIEAYLEGDWDEFVEEAEDYYGYSYW